MPARLSRPCLSLLPLAYLPMIALALDPGGSAQDPFPKRVTPGEVIERQFHFESHTEVEETTTWIDGKKQPSMGDYENRTTVECSLQVKDLASSSQDGQPSSLLREYVEGRRSSIQEMLYGTDERTFERSSSSLLEDSSVEFHLDEDEWIARWPAGEQGDSDLLEDLQFDLSLSILLPEDSVQEGDAWEIPAEAFVELIAPGKELHLQSDSDGAQVEKHQERIFEGAIQAKFTGTEEVDGRELSVVELNYELTYEKDPTEVQGYSTDTEGKVDLKPGTYAESSTWEGAGQFRWDVAAGHLYDLSLEGELTKETESSMESDWGNGPVEINTELLMGGTTTIKVTFH